MWLLAAPQFVVVSPYYESSLVIGNGAASIAATNGGSGGQNPLRQDFPNFFARDPF